MTAITSSATKIDFFIFDVIFDFYKEIRKIKFLYVNCKIGAIQVIIHLIIHN